MEEAEVYRVLGELETRHRSQPSQAAEDAYVRSLDAARLQKAKGWELRTAIGLAEIWKQQRRRCEARDLLAPIYNWFTEGFDTRDLREAKALLEELG